MSDFRVSRESLSLTECWVVYENRRGLFTDNWKVVKRFSFAPGDEDWAFQKAKALKAMLEDANR